MISVRFECDGDWVYSVELSCVPRVGERVNFAATLYEVILVTWTPWKVVGDIVTVEMRYLGAAR